MGSVLILGGAGYIGSHVNKELNQKGYETVVFDNLVYGHREAVKWGEFVEGDLKDIKAMELVFEKYEIDAVMHFAAYAYVGESVITPEKYYYNNVVNTLNLLHAMMKYSCNRIVFSSTCATYGEPESVSITEDMPQRPINPYGKTKLVVENILKDYEIAYGINYAILRYFNAAGCDPDGEIGESHNPETHLIPLVLDAAGGQLSTIKVFGTNYDTPDGSCIRDYIHVKDLADAHIRALEYLQDNGTSDCFNLGNAQGTSVLEIIDAAERVTKRKIKVTRSDKRSGDPARLVGSNDKARRILGWQPKYGDIDTIIKDAWNWHENRKF